MIVKGETVTAEFFTAQTPEGHTVVFAYQQPVAIKLTSGECYARFDRYIGSLQLRITAALDVGKESVTPLSPREWAELEKRLEEKAIA